MKKCLVESWFGQLLVAAGTSRIQLLHDSGEALDLEQGILEKVEEKGSAAYAI